MRIFDRLAAAHGMDTDVWERHANPWSGWTRFPILPLLTLAIYARIWIGWWCLLPVAVLIAWTWINPRAFPPPSSTRSWMSRAVMGERVWLNHAQKPIPQHHIGAVRVLNSVGLLGLPLLVWGLWVLNPWATAFGVVVLIGMKMWFLDRMVWIFDDMARTDAAYRAWLR